MALFAVLALGLPTGAVALLEGAGRIPLPFNLAVVDEALPLVFRLHMLASGAVLLLIPLVLAVRTRPRLHRPLGRFTGLLVIAGALTSFPVAYESTSPGLARLGFAVQGMVWLFLLWAGVAAARARNRIRHQRYMLAMAAVSSGAIFTRLATAVIAAWDLPFVPLYSAAAWLGWLVPMALAFACTPGQRRRPARA